LYNNLGNEVQVGDPVTGYFIYTDRLPDGSLIPSSTENYGTYYTSVSKFEIQFGVKSAINNTPGVITVYNKVPTYPWSFDAFQAQAWPAEEVTLNDERLIRWMCALTGATGDDILPSDAIPTDVELREFEDRVENIGNSWFFFTSTNSDYTDDPWLAVEASRITWDLLTFTVSNLSASELPEEATQDIIDAVVGIEELAKTDGIMLLNSLEGASKLIINGDINDAIDKLNSFIKKVERLIRFERISESEGNALIDAANAVIYQLLNP
jgi:hypothetical protein